MDGPRLPGGELVIATVHPLDLVNRVKDPEIPVLSIGDLGIVRSVVTEGHRVTVTITPTYSGCPAIDSIRTEIVAVLADHGYEPEVKTVYSPAWTTAMISPEGRRRLGEIGIAPPVPPNQTLCPRCQSDAPTMVSEFGSTACKALMVCSSCREPFDLFKELN
ncbi:MAG: 1,2-phenylacetyl-CoA epoxidase subunit PaaD [Acidimicrobiia bacterium]